MYAPVYALIQKLTYSPMITGKIKSGSNAPGPPIRSIDKTRQVRVLLFLGFGKPARMGLRNYPSRYRAVDELAQPALQR